MLHPTPLVSKKVPAGINGERVHQAAYGDAIQNGHLGGFWYGGTTESGRLFREVVAAIHGGAVGVAVEIERLDKRLRELEEEKEQIQLLRRVFKLLERGIVVTPDGGYGRWPE